MKNHIWHFIAIIMLFASVNASAQQYRQALRAKLDAHRKGVSFTNTPTLFAFEQQKTAQRSQANYTQLTLRTDELTALVAARPEAIQMRLPTGQADRDAIQIELVQIDLFKNHDAPFYIMGANGKEPITYEGGLHYRGIVKNSTNPDAFACISIFPEGVMGLITDGRHEWNLGPEADPTRSKGEVSTTYALYDASRMEPPGGFSCGTSDFSHIRQEVEDLYHQHDAARGGATTKCVGEYFEVDNDIYVSFGSDIRATLNFLTGLFNQSQTLYDNDDIDIYLSGAAVWTIADGYDETDSDAALESFSDRIGSNFVGDIAQLVASDDVTSGGKSGLAAEIGFICGSDDGRHCYSDLYINFGNLPSYSWDLNVVTHEAGHLLGSRHTHACVWNGDDTAIDGCSGSTEGSCDLPGNPAGGGTIMSYCHNTSVGMNFTLGFGPQPRAVIQNYVNGRPCLQSCACSDYVTTAPAVMNPEQPVLLRKFEAAIGVTSTSELMPGAILQLDGGQFVDLKPGFRAHVGSSMLAYIDGCGGPEPEEQWENRPAAPDANERAQNTQVIGYQTLVVSPNPFESAMTVTFELSEEQPVTLRMLDLNGAIIYSWYHQEILTSGNYRADLESFQIPAGIYMIELRTDAGRHVRRVVKI
jgi:Metallo-peptidase family M12